MRRAIWLGPALLSACLSYTFEVKLPDSVTEQEVVVPARKPTPVDILFIVDNSGSMADEQENLARNFTSFINELAGSGDYRLAIVTTDVSDANLPACQPGQSSNCDPGEKQGLITTQFSPEAPNVLLAQDSAACTNAGIRHGCFRGQDPATRVIDSTLPRDRQIALFQDNVRVGSCGSGREQGLEAMALALENTEAGRCNEGFLRDNANLVVVIVSDEEDTPGRQDLSDYLTLLQRYKRPSQIRAAVIVGAMGNNASQCRIGTDGAPADCRCPDDRPPEGSHRPGCSDIQGFCGTTEYCQRRTQADPGYCENPQLRYWDQCNSCSFYENSTCCSALSGSRYVGFARAVEDLAARPSGVRPSGCAAPEGQRTVCLIDSICQAEFANTLNRIARELVLTNELILDPPAKNPAGVVVKINGESLVFGTDFAVSEDGSTLTFMGAKTPKEGEEVEVYYVVDE